MPQPGCLCFLKHLFFMPFHGQHIFCSVVSIAMAACAHDDRTFQTRSTKRRLHPSVQSYLQTIYQTLFSQVLTKFALHLHTKNKPPKKKQAQKVLLLEIKDPFNQSLSLFNATFPSIFRPHSWHSNSMLGCKIIIFAPSLEHVHAVLSPLLD